MSVVRIDHYNLRATRELLDELRDFYSAILGLEVGYRPPFKSFGYWLYAGENPILHLSEVSLGEVRECDAKNTFDHIALACTDLQSIESHLRDEYASGKRMVLIDASELESLRTTKQIVKFAVSPLEEGEMALPETRYLELVKAEEKLKSVEGELVELSEISGVRLASTGRIVSSKEHLEMLVDSCNEIPPHDLVILPKKLFLELKKVLTNVR